MSVAGDRVVEFDTKSAAVCSSAVAAFHARALLAKQKRVRFLLQGVSVAACPVLATIEMSVRLSVRHTLTLCENDAS